MKATYDVVQCRQGIHHPSREHVTGRLHFLSLRRKSKHVALCLMTTTKADPKWGWRMRLRPPLYTFYCMALQQDVLGDFIVLLSIYLVNIPLMFMKYYTDSCMENLL